MDEYDWTCDYCGAYMNAQEGFTTIFGTWRCTECGALNDVSPSNIIDIVALLKKGIDTFETRPLEYPEDYDGDDDDDDDYY